ncbi:hypothetical protein HPG69_011529 [Diceros bicornis minor]|uniref:C-type lectin domain-containing protein n=1 Tax=Diceros bicornis minor TaxID=77932 RepID=A0A7J7EJV8_DICBM|nr:hypothetical protein HPG69_011529 [Diceros bicornis minor]
MAEAITYADLRFVKAPLKKGIASRVGQDPEADEDGELTYENVQVPPVPGGSSSAPAGLGDKAGMESPVCKLVPGAHRPHPTVSLRPCSLQAVPRARRAPHLLAAGGGLHLPGNLQVSQQLQQMNRVLEATNSSLRQQLTQKMTQLGQREAALQGSRRELAQTQEALQVEQKVGLATKEQLQACQSDREKTKEDLQREEEERRNLEQRLSSMQDTLRPFFTCPSSDTCCPMGWVLNERSCFYVSVTQRSWEESRKHCKSLSSDLATFSDVSHPYFGYPSSLNKLLAQVGQLDSYWIGLSFNKYWQWIDGTRISGFDYRYYTESPKCAKLQSSWPKLQQEKCSSSLPCICEMEAFRYPDGDHSLH